MKHFNIIIPISIIFFHQLSFAKLIFPIPHGELDNPEISYSCYEDQILRTQLFEFSSDYQSDLNTLKEKCGKKISYNIIANLGYEKLRNSIHRIFAQEDYSREEINDSMLAIKEQSSALKNLPQSLEFDPQAIKRMLDIRTQLNQPITADQLTALVKNFPLNTFNELTSDVQYSFIKQLLTSFEETKCKQKCQNKKIFISQIIKNVPELNETLSKAVKKEIAQILLNTKNKTKQEIQTSSNQNSANGFISKQCKTANSLDPILRDFSDDYNTTMIVKDVCQQTIKVKTNSEKQSFSVSITLFDSNLKETLNIKHSFKNARSAQDYYRQLSNKE